MSIQLNRHDYIFKRILGLIFHEHKISQNENVKNQGNQQTTLLRLLGQSKQISFKIYFSFNL